MKKPVLATLGVIGACAACCTIPLAIPLLGGLSVMGLASMNWNDWTLVRVPGEPGAALAAAVIVGGGVWWYLRRKAAARCAAPAAGNAASPADSVCGCTATCITTKEPA